MLKIHNSHSVSQEEQAELITTLIGNRIDLLNGRVCYRLPNGQATVFMFLNRRINSALDTHDLRDGLDSLSHADKTTLIAFLVEKLGKIKDKGYFFTKKTGEVGFISHYEGNHRVALSGTREDVVFCGVASIPRGADVPFYGGIVIRRESIKEKLEYITCKGSDS